MDFDTHKTIGPQLSTNHYYAPLVKKKVSRSVYSTMIDLLHPVRDRYTARHRMKPNASLFTTSTPSKLQLVKMGYTLVSKAIRQRGNYRTIQIVEDTSSQPYTFTNPETTMLPKHYVG